TEETGPGRLGPAGVGDAPMNVLRLEVEPELPGDAVTQSIAGLRVQHHLWRTSRPAGEINNARVPAQRRFRVEAGIGLRHTGIKVRPTNARAADENAMFNLETFRSVCALGIRQQSAGVGSFEAITDVTGGEQRCA